MVQTWLSKKKLTINGLEADENLFVATLKNSDGNVFQKGVSEIDGATRLILPTDHHFFKRKHRKEQIVLHHTVGYLSGDAASLTRKKVSTAYLVGRNGNVFELFDPQYYSYHLGPNSTGGNKVRSQRTIAIELSNFGALREHPTKPDILVDSWDFPYCMKTDTDFYVNCPYRGYDYYATYTDAQMKALDSLLLQLCRKFNIQHSFLPQDERMKLQTKVPTAGIVSHVNYRKDKTDVSPAFSWEKISGR